MNTTTTNAPVIASPTKVRTTMTRRDRDCPVREHYAYIGAHCIGRVWKETVLDAPTGKWGAQYSSQVPTKFLDTKTEAVRYLIDSCGFEGADFWAYYGENWEEHAQRIQDEMDDNDAQETALEAVTIEQEATAAKALAANAIQAYAEDAIHDFHGDQALAQSDLERQLEAAGLVAQGKTRAAFDILKGLDTVVRDSIPCDVWRFLLDRLGLI